MKPDILHEDTDIIVCRKPAGIAVQNHRIGSLDLESMLKNYLAAARPSKRPPYLAVIHRLDQPVEGLLVFAKSPAAARELNRQLTTYQFGKYYKALLQQKPPKQTEILSHYLIKDGKTNTSRVCTKDTDGAREAVLTYKLLADDTPIPVDTYCVQIELQTGRHHQIRVQMSQIGCPIVGDKKYGAAQAFFPSGGHIALCAYRLEFRHPKTAVPQVYEIRPSFMPTL